MKEEMRYEKQLQKAKKRRLAVEKKEKKCKGREKETKAATNSARKKGDKEKDRKRLTKGSEKLIGETDKEVLRGRRAKFKFETLMDIKERILKKLNDQRDT